MELGEADFLAELRESFHSAEVPGCPRNIGWLAPDFFFPGNPGCRGISFLGVVGVGVLEDGLSMFFLVRKECWAGGV